MSVRRGGAQQEVMYSVNGHLLQVVKELGEGGFATVYAVQDVDSKEQFALKRVVTNDSTQKALVEKEINIMQSIRHPNIIDLVGYSCNPIARGHEYLIQMELCTGGTLLEHIVRRGQRRWGELEILGMFWQVCCAVEVLHSQSPPVAHRDLKTENIILTDRGRWKLIDFGSCTTRAKKYTTAAEIHEEELQIQKYSTPMYRAPEMADLYQKQLICEKVDIWALGCILYCMLFLLHPFQEGGSLVILNGCPPLPENTYSQYPKQILKRLFALRVSKRPDIAVVLEYLRKWKRFLEGGGDPEPDFSSHRKRSKSRKSGERKKSSRRAKAEAKTPSDSRTRSRTTGAAPTQADSGSDSASDSEDESRHQKTVAPTKATTAAASAAKPKAADDLLDFQWVADWKPFDGSEAASTPAPAPPQASAAKNVPDLLWFNDTPPQPVIQQRSPPLPVMQQPPMFQPFSASQAYQQALISPPQYGMGQMMYAQQPMYPYGMQQQQPYGMGRPQAAAARPQSPELLPQLNSRRQTAPPPPSVPQAKPNPPSQAELDFDFAFR